jgi:AAA+ ATPase superfamily predicted ATPase
MTLQPFVGRLKELEIIQHLWGEQAARMMVLYGRRRVGKSRLLKHWIRETGQRVVYWQAEPDTQDAHLRQFSQALFNHASPDFPAPADFTYASWEQVFAQIGLLAQHERLGVVIDEFTFLIASDPSIPGRLQRAWDQSLENSNLFLCLSGSHLGMMQREFLSDRAPLFGRASAKLHLMPLPFGLTSQYFPNYSAEQRMALYAVFGGIPFYWEQIDPALSVDENLRRKVFTPSSLLDAEAQLLLSDYVKELKNYVGILKAIGQGNNTLKDISNQTGIPATQLPAYLNVLADAGYVARFEPIIPLARTTRVGRYYITDPFLRFYFRFIAGRASQLALFEPDQALAEYDRHMPDFIGAHTWEEICREWVLRASNRGVLPLYPDDVQSAWAKDVNIDVVGVNRMRRHMILGECKWTEGPMNEGALKGLVEKAKLAVPDKEDWQVYFLGFSKSGFTRQAEEFAQDVAKAQPAGSRWAIAGCRLVDLPHLDRDLAKWASL